MLVAIAPPPGDGARANWMIFYFAAGPVDAKMQRHRNAGDDMRPLRFGVSADKIGERRATAEVKTKSREVVNLAGKGRRNWFRIVPSARKNKKIFCGFWMTTEIVLGMTHF
jgi:hypothetical protein